ncbi:unnamed protein product [Mucor hiemalis]
MLSMNTACPNTTNCLTQSQQTATRLMDTKCENNLKSPSLLIKNKSSTSSANFEHLQQAFNYCNWQINLSLGRKRVIAATFKRSFLPFKTYYEIEWPFDKSSMIWLQLDKQICMGIERVRRLGFTNLDVCLDEGLTKYISDFKLIDRRVESILIEILFIGGSYNNYYNKSRKDSVLRTSLNDKMEVETTATTNVRLLRLRRVHWWTKNYNLARVYHV